MKVLFIGDIVGSPGRKVLINFLPRFKAENKIDFCIANAENTAGGTGITCVIAKELYNCGVDAITLGNHTWSKREILNFIESDNKIVRPANYPENLPGQSSMILKGANGTLGVLNLLGRVYMEPIDCPFRAADRELKKLKEQTKAVFVDFHAEATSEKNALAWYLDGRVSCVAGTHTHVQTADEKILPFGTAFITDVGMTGPSEGIIGVDREIIIEKFLSQMPQKFEAAKGKAQINAILLEIDAKTGKSSSITRLFKEFD